MANEHQKIFEKLDEISTTLAAMGAICPEREKKLADLETRLRDIEAVQNKAAGVVAVVSLVLGSLGALITSLIKKGLAAQ